jgi:phosphoglycerate dehydrogenase-like enzyme
MLKDRTSMSPSTHSILVLSDPAAAHLKVLEKLPDTASLVVTADDGLALKKAPQADIIFNALFQPDLLRRVFPAASKVQWVHSISAGVDHVLFPELRASAVPLTNGRGAFARSLGEFVIAGALFFAKNVRGLLAAQAAGRWAQFDLEELHGRTMGIVGYGEIGRAAAARAHAFGMRVIAVRRRPALSAADPLLEAAYEPARVLDLVRESDYVVASAPNTPETRGMIGEREFGAMKPSAVVINVGRGQVIDEAALVKALESRRIRGAALDVFHTEPLPEGHPFYTLDNVFMSFHSADHVGGWIENAVDVFVGNYQRFAKGQPLENVVDKEAGY